MTETTKHAHEVRDGDVAWLEDAWRQVFSSHNSTVVVNGVSQPNPRVLEWESGFVVLKQDDVVRVRL